MTGFHIIDPTDMLQKTVTLRGYMIGVEEDHVTPIYLDPPPVIRAGWEPAPFNADKYKPLQVSIVADMTTPTSSVVLITRAMNLPPKSAITFYHIYRAPGASGGIFVLIATIPRSQTTYVDPVLAEGIYRYYVVAENADGYFSLQSNHAVAEWEGTDVPVQPFPCTSFAVGDIQGDRATFTWDFPAETWPVGHPNKVDKHGLYQGFTRLVDNIDPNVKTYTWTGLTPDTDYNNINIRRHNNSGLGGDPGWSIASNIAPFRTGHGALAPLFDGHVRDTVLFSFSTNQDENLADNQINTQTPLLSGTNPNYANIFGARRVYNKTGKGAAIITRALSMNKVVWLSAKPVDMGGSSGLGFSAACLQMASGSRDTQIRNYFADLVGYDKMIFFTFWHEPIGDFDATEDATDYWAAFTKIMQVVDDAYPGHKIRFLPLFEENRLRNLRNNPPGNSNHVDWALICPEECMPGLGGPRPVDLMGWDFYQYGGGNMATNLKQGGLFSHRIWRIDDMLSGAFVPAGSSPMPWMSYTPGVDIVYGLGEMSARSGAYYNYLHSLGAATSRSDIPPAFYTRDMLDNIFGSLDKYAVVSWFNSVGANGVYNDERWYPWEDVFDEDSELDHSSGGSFSTFHFGTSFVSLPGDTGELMMNVIREKLRIPGTVTTYKCNKLNPATGMPFGYVP